MVSWQGRLLKVYLRAQRLRRRPATELSLEEERAKFQALVARFRPIVEPKYEAVDAGGVRAEWVVPPNSAADRVVMYLHGGSYNFGTIEAYRALVANIAHAARTRALTVDYRVAPEHPFPAALEDAQTAYRWLLAGGAAPHRVVIAGDSAGGGLAVATLVALRDAGDPLPAAAVCLSPWTDLAASGESWTSKARDDLVLEPEVLMTLAQWYLKDADPRTPLASPLYANLAGLPPMLIQVSDNEILLSDATRLAERAEAAGVDVALEVWAGMQHVFQFSANLLPEARRAIKRIGAFILQACA